MSGRVRCVRLDAEALLKLLVFLDGGEDVVPDDARIIACELAARGPAPMPGEEAPEDVVLTLTSNEYDEVAGDNPPEIPLTVSSERAEQIGAVLRHIRELTEEAEVREYAEKVDKDEEARHTAKQGRKE